MSRFQVLLSIFAVFFITPVSNHSFADDLDISILPDRNYYFRHLDILEQFIPEIKPEEQIVQYIKQYFSSANRPAQYTSDDAYIQSLISFAKDLNTYTGISWKFLTCNAMVESQLKESARNTRTGAIGLTQIMPGSLKLINRIILNANFDRGEFRTCIESCSVRPYGEMKSIKINATELSYRHTLPSTQYSCENKGDANYCRKLITSKYLGKTFEHTAKNSLNLHYKENIYIKGYSSSNRQQALDPYSFKHNLMLSSFYFYFMANYLDQKISLVSNTYSNAYLSLNKYQEQTPFNFRLVDNYNDCSASEVFNQVDSSCYETSFEAPFYSVTAILPYYQLLAGMYNVGYATINSHLNHQNLNDLKSLFSSYYGSRNAETRKHMEKVGACLKRDQFEEPWSI